MLHALTACLFAAYPTPAEAGFHHCALIYDAPQRTADDFAYYVADDRQWLFDAFLFLIQTTPGGGRPMEGGTTLADWQYHLDRWFADGRDVPELERAVAAAADKLGPVSPRQVMFSIPRPDPKVTDFGDIDGDGVSESLATPDRRKKVLSWYLDTLRRRFEALAPKHLKLWGGYVMAETIPPGDEPLAQEMAAACHERGLKLLWIPWYRATGWDRWRECGIDVAIMQPNYAFLSVHKGKVRRDRLANCADLAAKHGLGVEMELAMAYQDPGAERLWRHYLCDGAAERWGYQQAASAWYLGTSNVEALARSEDARLRGMYDAMKAYLVGEALPDPDPRLTWHGPEGPLPWLGDQFLQLPLARAVPAWLEADLPPHEGGGTLDLFFDREAGPDWSGELRLEALDDDGQSQPMGWALAPPPVGDRQTTLRFRAVTVPLPQAEQRLRLRLSGGPATSLAEVSWSPATLGEPLRHAAYRAAYRVEPAPEAAYGDDGTTLTDGYVPDHGFSEHRSVGWYGQDVAIAFDLGVPTRLAGAEIVLLGGGMGAVEWPSTAVALYSRTTPPPQNLVASAGPVEGGWLAAAGVEVVKQRATDDLDGVLRFRFDDGTTARHLIFHLAGHPWLMLHEIRLLTPDGRNVALGRSYTLTPTPTPKHGLDGYPDDGVRLTDGLIAPRFSKSAVTGWSDDQLRTVTVMLPDASRRRQVTVWSLAGGRYGIWAPGEVKVEASADGQTWLALAAAGLPALAEPGDRDDPVGYVYEAGEQPLRFVRVTVRHRQGWVMLSEIEVD